MWKAQGVDDFQRKTACALPESTDLEKKSQRYKINSITRINEIKVLRNYMRTILKSNLKSVIHYCRQTFQ